MKTNRMKEIAVRDARRTVSDAREIYAPKYGVQMAAQLLERAAGNFEAAGYLGSAKILRDSAVELRNYDLTQ